MHPPTMDQKSGYCSDGVFRSILPPLEIPQDPNATMIPFLFRNISSYPNKPALIDSNSGDSFTFSQFKTMVAKFSYALNTQLGITKNDVVLIFAPNSIHYPICSYSIIALGAILTTVNLQLTFQELSTQIQDSRPKLIITVQEWYPKVEIFGLPVVILNSENSRNMCFSYKDLILNSGSVSELPRVLIRGDDAAALLYSSGKLGVRKGVILSHKNFIAASQMVTWHQRSMKERNCVYLCFLPMFHVYAFAIVLYAQLQEGNTVVSMEKFEFLGGLGVLEIINKYSVTHLWGVPSVIVDFNKQNLFNGSYIPSLKVIISVGAPLRKEMMDECAQKFPHVFVLQGYGMTETTAAISMEFPIKGSRHSGSSGWLLQGIEAQIVSLQNNRTSLFPNQYGEILVRGATMMQGYLNSPYTIRDEHGFVHTGDLGYIDDEGQLFVVGRVNELIRAKEFQVSPTKIEAHLLSRINILDAAVIPFPEGDHQVLIAFVVRFTNSLLTKEDVKRFIAGQVPSDLQVRKVIFVDSIPKSASGKILRHVLVEAVQSNKM